MSGKQALFPGLTLEAEGLPFPDKRIAGRKTCQVLPHNHTGEILQPFATESTSQVLGMRSDPIPQELP